MKLFLHFKSAFQKKFLAFQKKETRKVFVLLFLSCVFVFSAFFFFSKKSLPDTPKITNSTREFIPPTPHETLPIAEFQEKQTEKNQEKLAEMQLNPEEKKKVLSALVEVETEMIPVSMEKTEEYQKAKEALVKEDVSPEVFHAEAKKQRKALEEINAALQEDFTNSLAEKIGDKDLALRLVNSNIAEPNFVYELLEAPNDPSFSEQWNIPFVMNQQKSIAPEPSKNTVLVAIIDTGVDTSHEDLAGQFWTSSDCLDENGIPIAGGCLSGGYDFVDNDADPFPSDGQTHGTAVAGVLGAVSNNETGIASFGEMASPKTIRLMALRTCCTEQGFFEAYAIERAIYFAVQNGARIINMSLGGPTPSERIKQAIAYANANGVLVVVAAGNYGSDNDAIPMYPANVDLPNVMSVAALAFDGSLASFSNYGKETVDIAFPGKGILTTLPGNQYGFVNGTSFAAPLASAVLAFFVR